MANPEHILMVDGSGFIFRAFYALPPMTRPDGTPINAVYGFCNMILKMVSGMKADGAVVFFDAARKNFRNDIYENYKANRAETPEELIPQFSLIRQAADAFNLKSIEMEGFEADDLIATYAYHAADNGSKVTIVSADKDLMQLIDHNRGKGIYMFDPMKVKMIGLEEVEKKFGVTPDKVVDIQALAGDSSDNVPGIPGIGIKTAAQLINEFGSLEALLDRAGEIKQNKRRESLIEYADDARISKKLVQLCLDAPMTESIENFIYVPPSEEQLLGFADEQSFRTLRPRLEKWLKSTQNGADEKKASDNVKVVSENKETKVEKKQSSRIVSPPMPSITEYQQVTDIKDLQKWVSDAEIAGVVAIDTETDSLDAQSANMVGFSLSIEPGKACYVPLRHVVKIEAKQQAGSQGAFDFGDDAPSADKSDKDEVVTELHKGQIDFDKAMKLLKPMLEDKAILKVGQNIKYDMHVLNRELGGDVEIFPIDDTMVMSYVLDGAQNGHGMDELAKLHLDVETIKFKDLCGTGKSQISFAEVEFDKATEYAAEDADITLRLYQFFSKRLVNESMKTVYEKLDRPLIYTLAMMEREGVNVELKALDVVAEKCANGMEKLEAEIYKLAGEEFNIASPMQLGEILFDKLGYEGGKKNKKTGAWSTSADVLDKLSEEHELPQKVLDWRMLAKLKSTYADALAKQINKRTKRVHTTFAQSVTATGRLASNNPNLQNIPIRTEEGREIRKAFTAINGYKLIAADYSQVELRLVAHMADVKGLKEAFANGMDIHAATASQVFGVPIEGMDPMMRRNAKAINFGIIYGISQFGLARNLGISRHEAKEYIDAYMAKYPEITVFMEETKEFAHEHGYVVTPFGRKCYVPGINDSNGMRRSFAERSAINAPIQGGAADIMKIAMNRIYRLIKNGELDAKMLMQVHDELVFEVKEENIDKAKEIIKREMENAAEVSVPLIVDVGVGSHWGQAH